MLRETVSDLIAFIAVAREGSFTRAAVRLGVSQPALSQAMRGLEERLGLRLLNRTTRSVAPTEAGERLLRSIEPQFAQIEGGLLALTELRDKPSGIVRITSTQHAAETVLWPRLSKLMREYPDITVELVTDEGLTNIVSERFDAGVRVGEFVEKDMIAVRIGPEMRQAIVGTPDYFKSRPLPKRPEELTGQSAARHARRILPLGVREARPRNQRARRGPVRGQQPGTRAERRARRVWASLPAGGPSRRAYQE
jgi:DNA-binding transcriptional LysR family regulator